MKKHIFLKSGVLLAISLLNLSCSVFGIRSEETPQYEVLFSQEDKEIRSYKEYIVAKTVVKGEFKQAQGEAFRLLAGYIFGKNKKKQNISMTAPVLQEKSEESQRIAMTAPVLQSSTEQGWAMTFMMPSKYKLADLPAPNDKRVILEEVPAKIVAAIRYSGLAKKRTNDEKASELAAWLVEHKKYDIVSGPSYAGYNPPWTIPFLRRNEMMYEIKAKN